MADSTTHPQNMGDLLGGALVQRGADGQRGSLTDGLVGRLVCPEREPESKDSRWTQTIPAPLLAQAPKRLKAMLVALTLFCIVSVGLNIAGPAVFGWKAICAATNVVVYAVLTGMSLKFLFKIRSGRFDIKRLLFFSRPYQVLFCFAITFAELSVPRPAGIPYGISFVAVLIVLFPLFLPATPKTGVITAFLSATAAVGAGLLYMVLNERPVTDLSDYGMTYVFNYVTVALAVIPMTIVAGLAREVSKERQLGSYQLKERLGAGGMGEVWAATHRMLRRPAAIKLIRAEALSDDPQKALNVMQRFEREAQATAGLHSHNTIDLYDFGMTDDGTFYYVMELLDGFDADTLIKRFGPVSSARAVYLLRQICDSLLDAHRSGLIHRDIKPANIYVCRYGHKTDHVKVLDFGLVKTVATGDDAKLTNAQMTTGTPAFMAPEMALGEEAIDGRADIYAIGCVAYWLVTGHLVFERDTPMKTLLGHIQEAPTPPSAIAEIEIPDALEKVIMHCLEKKPADRPQTIKALDDALSAIAFDAEWDSTRADKWWSSNQPAPSPASQA